MQSSWAKMGLSIMVGSALTVSSACAQRDGGSMATEFDPFLAEAFSLGVTPGMGVAVVRGDDLVYARGFGFADLERSRPVTPETLFYIASTTKSFTAFAVALLDHREMLDLDAPLSRYLPTLQLRSPLSADSITLRDLLTHTHGIRDGGPVVFRTAFTGEFTRDQLLELLSDYPPSPTGRAFDYGNLGYNIASLAVDATLERGWQSVLREEVFEPLGMNSTSAFISRVDPERLALPYTLDIEGFRRLDYAKGDANMHAAGGHVTTVRDLAAWLEAHMNGGRMDGRQVFPAGVVRATHTNQAEQDREFAFLHRYGWGLGWDLGTYGRDTVVHRFGGFAGFRSHVSFMPTHRIGVVVQVNGGLGSPLADLVAQYVYDRILGTDGLAEKYERALSDLKNRSEETRDRIAQDRARRDRRSQELSRPLRSYTGTYVNPALGTMTWRLVDGQLRVSMGQLRGTVEVYDASKNQLRVEILGTGRVVTFAFSDGRAQSLSYQGSEFTRVKP